MGLRSFVECATDASVTTCICAKHALEVMRHSGTGIDIVMCDVYMPEIDGFKLLEIIGLESDLPVIMMSENGETSLVMQAITRGACDYLIKPIRTEELRNIWQHVIRKRGLLSICDEIKRRRTGYFPNVSNKKRTEIDAATCPQVLVRNDENNVKKPRIIWSVDLHQHFVNAVNQIGLENAVPKKLLDVMNVKGLTRENVASHLQKYRLYLKRLSKVAQEPCQKATFQASKDGRSGGTMRIMPCDRISMSESSPEEFSSASVSTPFYEDCRKKTTVVATTKEVPGRSNVLGVYHFPESGLTSNGNQNNIDSSALVGNPESKTASERESVQGQRQPSRGGQLDGFVDNWNIQPAPLFLSSCGQMHGTQDNIIHQELHHSLSEGTYQGGVMLVKGRSCLSGTGVASDGGMYVLDFDKKSMQLSVSDYLMNDGDIQILDLET
ncbi:hypothetical protein KP509_16G029800 [Ceratopteris richardii]|nr:hypothetical protein KP509_16G029800 [Ceratopteris richardii]KAH7387558.1 hypothetical protein KP509_16G029800 [Ceratopteris richardii]